VKMKTINLVCTAIKDNNKTIYRCNEPWEKKHMWMVINYFII
jgi:hypothetical protein